MTFGTSFRLSLHFVCSSAALITAFFRLASLDNFLFFQPYHNPQLQSPVAIPPLSFPNPPPIRQPFLCHFVVGRRFLPVDQPKRQKPPRPAMSNQPIWLIGFSAYRLLCMLAGLSIQNAIVAFNFRFNAFFLAFFI